ncbi:MAG: FGGY family carbohydrate kinase [Candidatus Pelethousia sp.]|nr:FGGY family carbohydrate kinase [Candidatus Pelethousia sp.]
MKYILSHDIGTTGVKSCLFDEKLKLKGSLYSPTDTCYLPDGAVLQQPEQWWSLIREAMRALMAQSGVAPAQVAGICVDGHMNGCIPVDVDRRLLLEHTPLWADFSATEQAARLEAAISPQRFYEITGCGMDMPIYPLAKLCKLKDCRPNIYESAWKFIATKDYINMKLTGRCCTDYSDASNSGMLDMRSGDWSDEIIQATGLDRAKLPELVESTAVIGGLLPDVAAYCGLIAGTPVVAGCGDVPSASVGAGAYREDVYYINIGSATWLSRSYDASQFLCDAEYKPFVLRHAAEGLLTAQLVSFGGGICFQWIVDMLSGAMQGGGETAKKAAAHLYESIEAQERDYTKAPGELFFLPYLRGGVPTNPRMKGSFIGLSMEHDAYDMIHAVQAGVAYHLRTMMPFISDKIDKPMTRVNIIGGGARSGRWCQLIADICGLDVICAPQLQFATARGTAVIGGVGCGLFDDFKVIDSLEDEWSVYLPDVKRREFYDRGYRRFRDLVAAMSDIS